MERMNFLCLRVVKRRYDGVAACHLTFFCVALSADSLRPAPLFTGQARVMFGVADF
jgi:hypothetical protein